MNKIGIILLWLLGLAAIAWLSSSAPSAKPGSGAAHGGAPSTVGHGEPAGSATNNLGEKK